MQDNQIFISEKENQLFQTYYDTLLKKLPVLTLPAMKSFLNKYYDINEEDFIKV